jgi:hypothetical protein
MILAKKYFLLEMHIFLPLITIMVHNIPKSGNSHLRDIYKLINFAKMLFNTLVL